VVGAGSGNRMRADKPKQFLRLGQRSVLGCSLALLCGIELVDAVVAVVPAEYVTRVRRSVQRDPEFLKVRAVVAGGAQRQDSVLLGLQAIDGPCNVVAVHDAARPLAAPAQIERALRVAGRFGAAILAVPVVDTIKQATDEGVVLATLDRRRLWAAQTPQCFEYNLLLDAFRAAAEDNVLATDDASLVERMGARVILIPGSDENVKITGPADLELARLALKRRNRRG